MQNKPYLLTVQLLLAAAPASHQCLGAGCMEDFNQTKGERLIGKESKMLSEAVCTKLMFQAA